MTDGVELVRLVLVRHAEATSARGDPHLSELGQRQARQLRRRLQKSGELRGATRLFSSDLARTTETADTIAPALGERGLAVERDRSLGEMFWGEAEGLSWEDLVGRYGPPVGRDHVLAPGAESWGQFERRARAALQSCAEQAANSTVVVVCHTGVIECSFIEFAGLGARAQRFAMRPRNSSMTTWVTAGQDTSRRVWRLEGYNDSSHLWTGGTFSHGTEDYELLESAEEPFWVGVEGAPSPDEQRIGRHYPRIRNSKPVADQVDIT